MAFLPNTPEWVANIYRIERNDPVVGANPLDANDVGIANLQARDLAKRTAYLKEGLDALRLKAALTVTVGAGGDFATINEALAYVSERRPAYMAGGFTVEMRLLSGFIMAEQVVAVGVNLGWVNITAEDALVTINRAALTGMVIDAYPAFSAYQGGILPTIACLFEMNTAGSATGRHGIMLRGGQASIAVGCGIRQAGAHGLFLRSGSAASAFGADFRNAGKSGVHAIKASSVNAGSMNLSNCGVDAVVASGGSVVSVDSSTITGAGNRGVYAVLGGRVICASSNCRTGASDNANDIVVWGGGIVHAQDATGGTSVTPNTVNKTGIIFK